MVWAMEMIAVSVAGEDVACQAMVLARVWVLLRLVRGVYGVADFIVRSVVDILTQIPPTIFFL